MSEKYKIGPTKNVEELIQECPRCGNVAEPKSTIRQDPKKYPGIVDVGWCCIKCGKEWGFEVIK